MVVPVDISIPAADAVVRMVSFLYRRHCGIRFAVVRLAAAVSVAAVRVVRRAKRDDSITALCAAQTQRGRNSRKDSVIFHFPFSIFN